MSSSTKLRRERAYEDAIALVQKEGVSLAKAVATVRQGINVTTLHRRLKVARNGDSGIAKKVGRPPVLSAEQEGEIAKLCLKYASRGAPITMVELASLVQEMYGSSSYLTERFKDGKPGRDWISRFCVRNNLSLKKPRKEAAERRAIAKSRTQTKKLECISKESGG